MKYVASWREIARPHVGSAWVPMPWEQARTTLTAELRHNLEHWTRAYPEDTEAYADALKRLEKASEPNSGILTITLPRHVLTIGKWVTL